MLLNKIKSPDDLKKIPISKLNKLADEMRDVLINRVSKIGGHVGPNLGAVESTIALHYVFNSPKDKIIFDVSHQSYCHKLLTGRAFGFIDDKRFADVSGYTNPKESKHDMFAIGHTSTSISLAIGVAKARDLNKQNYSVVAFIGDGSLSGGQALEGLNAIKELHSKLIVILNDNQMCMAENHGGLYDALSILRSTKGKSKNNIFKSFGYDYLFVENGNNINQCIEAFKKAKKFKNPLIVHICTNKGNGYIYADKNKEPWHFMMPFNPKTGKLIDSPTESYSSILRKYILNRTKTDKKFLVITSATPGSAGLDSKIRKSLGKQYIDVGIAEQTAASVAAGYATAGNNPLWTINSTFIQRAYDQISHDICLNNAPVAVSVMFNGVYSLRDVTHLGFFDIPLLSNIPNLVYLAPTCVEEYLLAIEYALNQRMHPVFVRAPGGIPIHLNKKVNINFDKTNKYLVTKKGKKIAFLGLGSMYWTAKDAASLYEKKTGVKPTLINPLFITGLDTKLLDSLLIDHDAVVTIEDGIIDGGFGQKISSYYGHTKMRVFNYGLKKQFVDRYDLNKILTDNHLNPTQIVNDLIKK